MYVGPKCAFGLFHFLKNFGRVKIIQEFEISVISELTVGIRFKIHIVNAIRFVGITCNHNCANQRPFDGPDSLIRSGNSLLDLFDGAQGRICSQNLV